MTRDGNSSRWKQLKRCASWTSSTLYKCCLMTDIQPRHHKPQDDQGASYNATIKQRLGPSCYQSASIQDLSRPVMKQQLIMMRRILEAQAFPGATAEKLAVSFRPYRCCYQEVYFRTPNSCELMDRHRSKSVSRRVSEGIFLQLWSPENVLLCHAWTFLLTLD